MIGQRVSLFSFNDETIYVSQSLASALHVDFHARFRRNLVKPDFKIVPPRILKRPELSYVTSLHNCQHAMVEI